jgi:hypothetical protein
MTKKHTVRVELPQSLVQDAQWRIDDIIRACMWEENIIESIALSCYLQGCNDTLQLIEQRPEFVAEYQRVIDGK